MWLVLVLEGWHQIVRRRKHFVVSNILLRDEAAAHTQVLLAGHKALEHRQHSALVDDIYSSYIEGRTMLLTLGTWDSTFGSKPSLGQPDILLEQGHWERSVAEHTCFQDSQL